MNQYPEHEKLKKISDKSQACYDFLNHLYSYGYVLARWDDEEDDLMPENPNIQNLLAEFFDINLKNIEDEKLIMLAEIRALHE